GDPGRRGGRRQEAEAPSSLLQSTDLRAGAALPAAAVPVGARARAPGQPHPPYAHAGQDLVPEPSLQDEACPGRERYGGDTPALAAPRGRARLGQGRQTVPRAQSPGPGSCHLPGWHPLFRLQRAVAAAHAVQRPVQLGQHPPVPDSTPPGSGPAVDLVSADPPGLETIGPGPTPTAAVARRTRSLPRLLLLLL
ncbi:hypothetical protein LEMLEM_LOCUS564, partial [Lemmus lemmus]